MAREKDYLNLPIGVAFSTSSQKNAKVTVKVVKNKNIDEIIALDYNLPGIPKNAEIVSVVMGDKLVKELKLKYNKK
jgi:coenzyme F420-reducing hydrogenase gamma subunit